MTIGEIARLVHLRPSAIRYYESVGLLPEPKRVSGRRSYNNDVLQALRLIQMAQSMGFTIAEIRALLTSFPPETPPAERWQTFSQRKLAQIDAFIQQAVEQKSRLEQTLACRCASLEECSSMGSPE
jgi:MerR family redox-sensitive transcriptional activator SoxR